MLLLAAMVNFDSLWNWSDPAESERWFRALPASAEVQTQIARAQGLQGKFAEGHATLDAITTNAPSESVRLLLERGRLFNSAGQRDAARPLFAAAWDQARAAALDDLAVDAAHMLAIVEPPPAALRWNERALELAEQSRDPAAQQWVGSLLNNIGWTYFDLGEPARALKIFERDRDWFAARQKTNETRIARYAIGRMLRALKRHDEALAAQRAIERESPDGYVAEEIGECLVALRRTEEARPYFRQALEWLGNDEWLKANAPARLQRWRELANP
jgi:tetratricopeptide (TPR) repeat protein